VSTPGHSGATISRFASSELLGYWENNNISEAVYYKEKILRGALEEMAKKYQDYQPSIRGRGLIYGIHFPEQGFCAEVSSEAFERGLIIELAGASNDVLKFLPPLLIEEELLKKGLQIIDESIAAVLDKKESMIHGTQA